MNKVLAVGALVILGMGTWLLVKENDGREEGMMSEKEALESGGVAREETTTMAENGKQRAEGAMMNNDERYLVYAPEVLAEARDTRRVLFFYASWCPFCKPADTELREKVREIPEDVTVIRVNYNDPDTDQAEKNLASQYGVTYQHTFVQIDEEGKVVTKWNGGKLAELLENIQ